MTIPFKRFGVMPDMSRNAVMSVPTLKRFADLIADLGYNALFLYTEDTYEIPEEPYFGHGRGRYSQEDIREIVAYCEKLGIEVIPCIQTLAHLECFLKWKHIKNKYCDVTNILLVEEEETENLIRNMLRSIKASYKTKYVHVGMDEAHLLGVGKYLDKHGYHSRFEILSKHLKRVCEIAKEEGLEPNIWADMFFRMCNDGKYFMENPKLDLEKIGELPENLSLSCWDYYNAYQKIYMDMIRAHQKLGRETWFAGGIWTWKGFAPDNRFSIRSATASMEACKKLGVDTFYMTMWCEGGGGTSRFAGLPALYAISRIAAGETSMKKIAEGFEEKYGIPFARFIDLDLTTKKKGKVSRGGTVTNPESYLLLNDPLLGRMDSTLMGGEGEFYRLAARRLAKNAKHPEFGYLFRSQAALARTLSRKADLTVRTRKAYLENDREAMGEILRKDYPYIQKNLKEFIAAFRALWLYDNNPQGLEVQEARLGGLRQRLESCEERLWDWVENNTRIPELEEEVLDIRGKGRDLVPGHFFFDTWVNVVSAGRT